MRDDNDDTVIRPRRRLRGEAPEDGRGLIGASGSADDDPFGDTVLRAPRAEPDTLGAADDTVIRAARPRAARPPAGAAPTSTPEPFLPAVASRAVAATVTRVPSVRIGSEVYRLDRPVIIGRRPAGPRIVRGPVPHLVTVPSPSGQVSASHVLLLASGEAAVVEDLRSTNGTVVRPVAGLPFRLASGGSVVVLTGTVVEIGDGNAIEILSPHLRAAPGDLDPATSDGPWSVAPTGTLPTTRERS